MVDLFQQGEIPHPYWGRTAEALGWVSDCTWVYKAEFHASNLMGDSKYIRYEQSSLLLLSGLDTYASIDLNGHTLGEFSNPHRSYLLNLFGLDKVQGKLKSFLKPGLNELTIVLKPPLPEVARLAARAPYPLPGGVWLHSRKAAYQFGWDWARALPSVGIAGRIELVAAANPAKSIRPPLRVRTLGLRNHNQIACMRIEGLDELGIESKESHRLSWFLQGQGWSAQGTLENPEFELRNPQLWWPVEMGDPCIHHAQFILRDLNGKPLFQDSLRFGIRTVQLLQEPDSLGRSFQFRINGQNCYIQGANWVPHDLWPMMSDTVRTGRLLDLALESGMNMLRIWGGGHYASDALMELCDRKGMMVWQDFAYACAMFPTDTAFLAEAKAEAEEQILRLRSHPSLMLWCGNNEVEEGWHNWGWVKEMNYAPSDSAAVWQAYARFFHRELPALIARLDGERPYHPSSPSNGWGRDIAYREGDVHQWAVWWGMKPFRQYGQKIGRFVSEFGFQGFPTRRCMKEYGWDRFGHLNDSVLRMHQNHPRGFETIAEYLRRDYLGPFARLADSAAALDWVYWSGMLQADAMEEAVRAQRGYAPWCSGSIIWQLNDAWPVVSWSLVDYSLERKPAWYAVRRVFGKALPPRIAAYPDTAWHWPCSQQGLKVRIDSLAQNLGKVIVESKIPLHRLWLEGDGLTFEDNSLDLDAHKEYHIGFQGDYESRTSVTLESFCPAVHGVDRFTVQIPFSSSPR
jgi:beta-mannosidase